MKKLTLPLVGLAMLAGNHNMLAQVPVKPAHVIIVMEENYAYDEIIGNSLCPILNAVSKFSYTALFNNYYAIEHPSEPNYLDLFSGQNQGITSDVSGQNGGPLTDCNLGASLIQKGYTFAGYSEDQPTVGWYSSDDSPYWTKHCPWINWINCPTNDSIPVVDDIPYSDINSYTGHAIFPDSNNYASLPTVTWVIPNSINDMHDNSENSALPAGDSWFHKNMMSLVRYASVPSNNTVVFVTWDEDDGSENNKVVMMAISGLIKGGTYSTSLNHYGWLREIEEMYGLTECSNSASATLFPNAMWVISGVNAISANTATVETWPVPAQNNLNVKITTTAESNPNIGIYDVTGRLVKSFPAKLISGENTVNLNISDVSNGIYILTVKGENINVCKQIEVVK
jgi:phosphatidylinositol-3-phosphatase